jgi:hypothetical protein
LIEAKGESLQAHTAGLLWAPMKSIISWQDASPYRLKQLWKNSIKSVTKELA